MLFSIRISRHNTQVFIVLSTSITKVCTTSLCLLSQVLFGVTFQPKRRFSDDTRYLRGIQRQRRESLRSQVQPSPESPQTASLTSQFHSASLLEIWVNRQDNLRMSLLVRTIEIHPVWRNFGSHHDFVWHDHVCDYEARGWAHSTRNILHQVLANGNVEVVKNAAHYIQMCIYKASAASLARIGKPVHTLHRLWSEEIVRHFLDTWDILFSHGSKHVWPIL